MANLTAAESFIDAAERPEAGPARIEQADSPPPPPNSGSPWNYSTVSALFLLVVVWAVKLYTTWGAWGNLSVDSGHEMYIPLLLAEGKQLYRDVWSIYGPAAPYFNSYLYRLFGVHLDVLYWAGSLSALGSAVFLFLTGMRLSSWVTGWAAGAVVLIEAFQPSLFCFPLPYAAAAVYGCLIGCVFLWLVVNASFSRKPIWVFAAGTAAAVALLLKLEFGIACYGALAFLIAARTFTGRSWRLFTWDVAAIFPGVAVCGLVIRWMVSIAGVEFITQENLMSWPTAYFMKTYGKLWVEHTGFTVSVEAFEDAFHRTITVAVFLLAAYVLVTWRRYDTRALLVKTMIVLALALYLIKNNYFLLSMKQDITQLLTTIFFPRDMVLYVVLAAVAAWCYFLWRPAEPRNLAISLLLTFSGLLAFRILMKMRTAEYSIYYNGPVVLSFLFLLSMIIPRSGRSRRFALVSESVLCLACLTPVFVHTRMIEAEAKDFVPLVTPRGTVRVSKSRAENYAAAIQFMKEKASAGQSVLSVPEDTSLYFFSGTYCPTRVFLFTPGALAPGKMVRETIEQIEKEPVRYLLWSNRKFPEYGVPVFGQDFDVELGDYLKTQYRPVGPLTSNPVNEKQWSAVVWERKQEGQAQ